jgi:minor histocompatibility antigen H13
MVTVAKAFNAPVKLLFPKDLFAAELQFSMLGLGDIVIPGNAI